MRVWERIDQRFATDTWLNLYLESSITHLFHFASDYCPLLVSILDKTIRGPQVFCFEKILAYLSKSV